jgi:hypothetical protein
LSKLILDVLGIRHREQAVNFHIDLVEMILFFGLGGVQSSGISTPGAPICQQGPPVEQSNVLRAFWSVR